MKYLPINLDRSGYKDLRPTRDWFEDGDKNKCKTIDAKLLMELYKRVNDEIFCHIVSLTDMLNASEWTFEKAYEELKKDLEREIEINKKALAYELILKDKNRPYWYYYPSFFDDGMCFARYSISELVELPD